jgi:threonine dehydrogenase-like Zn-dependent dehydrogenase
MTGVCGTDVEVNLFAIFISRVSSTTVFSVDLCQYVVLSFKGYFKSGLSSFPLVPGHEWCGVIVESCNEVSFFARALDSDSKEFPVGKKVVGEVSVGCGSCGYCPSMYNRCLARTETGVAKFVLKSSVLT